MPLFNSIDEEFDCEVQMSVNHAAEMIADGEWSRENAYHYFEVDGPRLAPPYDRTAVEFVDACKAALAIILPEH